MSPQAPPGESVSARWLLSTTAASLTTGQPKGAEPPTSSATGTLETAGPGSVVTRRASGSAGGGGGGGGGKESDGSSTPNVNVPCAR